MVGLHCRYELIEEGRPVVISRGFKWLLCGVFVAAAPAVSAQESAEETPGFELGGAVRLVLLGPCHRLFEQLGSPITGLGDGFTWKSKDLDHSAELAQAGWEQAKATVMAGEHFMVVLDEIMYPLRYGWIPLESILSCLRERPPHVHVVLTGRNAPAELIELADTVTEMTLIKHHFKAGVPAQRGIED